MSIATFLWALAFTSTEPPASRQAAAVQHTAAIELEAELASSTGLYLVASLRDGSLAGCVRGACLFDHDAEVRVLVHSRGATASVEIPRVVRTTSWAMPRGLEFHDPNAPAGTPAKKVGPPSRFRAFLDNGWQLVVLPRGERLPEQRWTHRLRDGWRAVRGRRAHRPPLLAIWLPDEQARALYHVLAPDVAVLLVERRQPRLDLPPPPEPAKQNAKPRP